MLNLSDFWPLISQFNPPPHITHASTLVSVGICCGKCSFHPPVWIAKVAELQYNTHCCEAGFLSCPCATLALSRRTVLRWDSGGSGRIWATAGHQSHCGISSTRPIRRLQPVKVSVLLMPDCKSSSRGPPNAAGKGCHGFIFSLTVLLCGRILQFVFFFLLWGNSWEESSPWQRCCLQCAAENGKAQWIQLSYSFLLCISPNHLTLPCKQLLVSYYWGKHIEERVKLCMLRWRRWVHVVQLYFFQEERGLTRRLIFM